MLGLEFNWSIFADFFFINVNLNDFRRFLYTLIDSQKISIGNIYRFRS
jgi:hypothetical protein